MISEVHNQRPRADDFFVDYPQCSNQSDVSLTSAQIWGLMLRTRGKLTRISSDYYMLTSILDFNSIYIYIIIYIMNNIIQWNCRGLRANFTDFRLLCGIYNPIVCCLQETMLTNDDFIIRGFNCIHLD